VHCGVAARARFVQGDFFAGVPEGGDLYLLKSILHNWNDTEAAAILNKCRDAMPGHSRLVLAERIVPSGNGPAEAKLFDIGMLVSLGGKERTAEEYEVLLRAAGLKPARVVPTASPLSLIEALPKPRNETQEVDGATVQGASWHIDGQHVRHRGAVKRRLTVRRAKLDPSDPFSHIRCGRTSSLIA
jgi:hypothetical protein